MIKKTKDEITKFLESIFSKSNITKYLPARFINDDDINYIIVPKTGEHKIKNDFELLILVYCSDVRSLTLYCPLIFKLQSEDSTMFTLNAINDTNSKLSVGKIYLNDDHHSISYINKILFNNMINDLTPTLMNEYIDSFLFYSLEFYNQMKKRKQ